MTNVSQNASSACRVRSKRAGAFELDDRLFSEWVRVLDEKVGVYIAAERKSFLAAALRMRMRETGCDSYRDYYSRVAGGIVHPQEWSLLIDCLTVHETSFFRHKSSIALFEELVRVASNGKNEGFNVWSVGCASGEEAYSLAMIMDHCFGEKSDQPLYGLAATDISLPVLEKARSGVYLNRRINDIPAHYQQKYCKVIGDHRFEIDPDLKKRVCFTRLNLKDVERAPFRDLAVIYCQNVLIYFDRVRRFRLADALAACLRPGGVMILGPGELLNWKHPEMDKMRYSDTLAFRRKEEKRVTRYGRNQE